MLRLHQKKAATLIKGSFLSADSKLGSVPAMINKEALFLFLYKPTKCSQKLFY